MATSFKTTSASIVIHKVRAHHWINAKKKHSFSFKNALCWQVSSRLVDLPKSLLFMRISNSREKSLFLNEFQIYLFESKEVFWGKELFYFLKQNAHFPFSHSSSSSWSVFFVPVWNLMKINRHYCALKIFLTDSNPKRILFLSAQTINFHYLLPM